MPISAPGNAMLSSLPALQTDRRGEQPGVSAVSVYPGAAQTSSNQAMVSQSLEQSCWLPTASFTILNFSKMYFEVWRSQVPNLACCIITLGPRDSTDMFRNVFRGSVSEDEGVSPVLKENTLCFFFDVSYRIASRV